MHDYSAILLFIPCDAATCLVPIAVAILAFLTAVWNGISAIVIKNLELEKKRTASLDHIHAKHKDNKHDVDETNTKASTHAAGKP